MRTRWLTVLSDHVAVRSSWLPMMKTQCQNYHFGHILLFLQHFHYFYEIINFYKNYVHKARVYSQAKWLSKQSSSFFSGRHNLRHVIEFSKRNTSPICTMEIVNNIIGTKLFSPLLTLLILRLGGLLLGICSSFVLLPLHGRAISSLFSQPVQLRQSSIRDLLVVTLHFPHEYQLQH